MDRWTVCHNADRDFRGISFAPQNRVELPSPAIAARAEQVFELDATTTMTPRSLPPTVVKPLDETPPVPSVREPPPDWPLRAG